MYRVSKKTTHFCFISFVSDLDQIQRHRWKAATFVVKMVVLILKSVQNCGFKDPMSKRRFTYFRKRFYFLCIKTNTTTLLSAWKPQFSTVIKILPIILTGKVQAFQQCLWIWSSCDSNENSGKIKCWFLLVKIRAKTVEFPTFKIFGISSFRRKSWTKSDIIVLKEVLKAAESVDYENW